MARRLRTISPRTIDRRLQACKRQIRRRLYGRTKPGTLLKHHIPIRTEHWHVTTPGFTEIDLVSHSGNWAEGEFPQSLSVKLVRKTRVGARLRRKYDRPQTPLDRLLASGLGDSTHLRALQRLRTRLDPFALAAAIDRKLTRIYRLANRRHSPRAALPAARR